MKIKKFVALLLVLLLCIGIFPVSAFADDSEGNVVAVEETAEQIIEEVESDPIEEDLIPKEPASANEEAEDAEIVEEGIDAEEEIPEDASAEDALAEDISEEEIVEEEPEEANDSEMSDSAITEDRGLRELRVRKKLCVLCALCVRMNRPSSAPSAWRFPSSTARSRCAG